MSNALTLTPKLIRALTCPEGKVAVYFRLSNDLHLFVQVMSTGRKTLVYRRYLDKTWRQMQLGDWSDKLDDALAREVLKSANARAAEIHAMIARGENPFDKAKNAKDEPTLQELFDHYKVGHLDKRSKRVTDAVNDFRRWFGSIANKKVSWLTHAEAHRFHSSLSKKTPISANRAVQLARAMFNFGLKTRFIEGENPFGGVSLNRENERDRVLTDKEAGKLLSALDAIPAVHSDDRTLRDWVLLSLMTGARKGNILSMRWEELDLKAKEWTIPAKKMKTGKSQIIPLGSVESTLLTERKALLKKAGVVSPWVFPGNSKLGHIVDPGNAWEALRKRLKMEDLWIHDLRRSLASSMANTGADVSIVRAALNHSDTRTTLKAYIRTNQQVQLEARQKAQDAWLTAMKRQAEEAEEPSTDDSVVAIAKAKRKKRSASRPSK